MAGYSDTPLAKKLGIKEGFKISLIKAPVQYRALLAPDRLDNLRRTGSRSASKQSHDFTVGEHVSSHGIQNAVSVVRSGMDLGNVERIEAKYVAMLPQRRARRRIGGCV